MELQVGIPLELYLKSHFQVNAMVTEKKSSVKTLKEEAEKLDDLYHQKLKVELFYIFNNSLLLITLSLRLVFICKNLLVCLKLCSQLLQKMKSSLIQKYLSAILRVSFHLT